MYDIRLIWREPVLIHRNFMPTVLCIGGFGELGELGYTFFGTNEVFNILWKNDKQGTRNERMMYNKAIFLLFVVVPVAFTHTMTEDVSECT